MVYQASSTPYLTSISPRYGNVVGGEEITFSGSGFAAATNDVEIIIDGIECTTTQVTDTEIKCTTGPRPGLVNSSLSMVIAGKGKVATQDKQFVYANYWSADTTWGGEYAPMELESVYVPVGLNLLVDVDETPELNAVIVEGSLIFAPHSDPTHQRYFDAHYVFVNGGSLEIGTEEHPYTSKLTITMHGTISDPYIPTYGNKCIGLRYGRLDMHGKPREPTWTSLESTAEVNATTITLQEAVDWQEGEEISIASTSYQAREAEKRMIIKVDRTNPDKPVLTLDQPLVNRHYAATETYGDQDIEMRAEVGLLSRNIVYRGDNSSKEEQYGAIIFMHSFGDESLKGRISYVEFANTGQAFKEGRYTVHYHLIG